jgi:hypothetical protein
MYKFLLLIVAGVGFVAVRVIKSMASKASQNSMIKKVKQDPSKAESLIDSLDITYGKLEEINRESFELIKRKVSSSAFIGSYRIAHSVPVNEYQFIIFTELSFSDFDVTVTGKGADVTKTSHHNFLLDYDKEKSQMILFSNLYSDSTDKFQKQDFLKSLLKTETN